MKKAQDKQKCIDSIKNIKKQLVLNGYNVFAIDEENILCKTPKRVNTVSNNTITGSTTTAVAVTGNCCPYNPSGSIKNNVCTCNGNCNVSPSDCPIFNGNGSSNNNSSSDTNSGTTDSTAINLFRIKTGDTYFGINVHAVILRGETCELKLSFGYERDEVQHIVDAINYLVM